MKDKELESLESETEKAWSAALVALSKVINRITMERNYYRDKCEKTEEKK